MFKYLLLLVLPLTMGAHCPRGTELINSFVLKGQNWEACEDLQRPGGDIVLVGASGEMEWFAKGYEVFGSANDDDFYLGLGKKNVTSAKSDILALTLLNGSSEFPFVTWERVASAIPPLRGTGLWFSVCQYNWMNHHERRLKVLDFQCMLSTLV